MTFSTQSQQDNCCRHKMLCVMANYSTLLFSKRSISGIFMNMFKF